MNPVDLYLSQQRALGVSVEMTQESHALTALNGFPVKGDDLKLFLGETRYNEACEMRGGFSYPSKVFASYKKKEGWFINNNFYVFENRTVYLNADRMESDERRPYPGEYDQMIAELSQGNLPERGESVRVGNVDTLLLAEPSDTFVLDYNQERKYFQMPIVLLNGKHTPVPAGWIVKI